MFFFHDVKNIWQLDPAKSYRNVKTVLENYLGDIKNPLKSPNFASRDAHLRPKANFTRFVLIIRLRQHQLALSRVL